MDTNRSQSARRASMLTLTAVFAVILVVGVAIADALAGGLYRHVDERGRVTYSDVPSEGASKPMKPLPSNAASQEANKQLEMARREQIRHEAQEREAAYRRTQAQSKSLPAPAPEAIAGRRGGYDPSLPNAQPASDTARRY